MSMGYIWLRNFESLLLLDSGDQQSIIEAGLFELPWKGGDISYSLDSFLLAFCEEGR